jgi:S1-C subfamily serine protease
MGSGHIRYGHGVPHQLRDLGVRNVGTLLPAPFDLDCKELRPGLADAVFVLPQSAKAKAEPPRLGVRLEEKDGIVRIANVTIGSLAETTGLRTGAQLVEVAGLPVDSMLRAITAIRLQPAGTWLPMRVKRGDDTLELVVKFPAKQ